MTKHKEVPSNFFKFALGLAEHCKGNAECKGCRWERPSLCKEDGCGGFVHIEFIGEANRIFEMKCEACGGDVEGSY